MQTCSSCKRGLDRFGRLLPRPNPDGYISPLLAVDAVVIKQIKGINKVLLIKRTKFPGRGKYAFPGGHVNYGESLENAVLRELKEECNLDGKIKSLICVNGSPLRDPRKHYISAYYNIDVDNVDNLNAGDDASDAQFIVLDDIIKNPEAFAIDEHLVVLQELVQSTQKI